MTKKNDSDNLHLPPGGSNSVMIVQQAPMNEATHHLHQQPQHFVLSAVNNSAPMIITTPLAAPSIVTQPLATATNPPQQTQIVNSMTNTPVVTTVPNKSNKSPGQDRLVCSLCNKVYRSSAGLRYHKRKRHRDEGMMKPTQLHRVRCLENGCNYQMLAISDLRNHLANHHLKPAYKTTEEKKFNSFAEFTEWKAAFEQSSGSKYVKNCGSKGKSENQTTEYYYCNRTGLYKQNRQGWRRNSKALDSLRCGIHCTSSMKVDISRNDQVSVQYYPTHYGHTAEPPLQAPNGSTALTTTNGDLVDSTVSVPQQTIPPIQTVVQAAVQQQTQSMTTTTDHCVRLQHQHHGQTSSIIINIAPVNTTIINIHSRLYSMTKKGSSAASSPSANGDNAASAGRFVCSLCAKVYRSGAGLRYHKRKRHRGMTEPTALHRVKCQEPGCGYQMLAISDLRNHLSNHHHKTEYKCTEERKFTSIADFTDWKSTFESSTGSKYVKNCGAKGKSDNQTTEYYYCNRTGPFGQGLRRNKAQGSARAGIHCTSSMKVEIQTDEHITVQYYPAHYGHSHTLGNEEQTIASENDRISNGATHTHVQEHSHQSYQAHTADRSSSSSPGSASTSPSAGSNSNSTHHPSTSTNDRHTLSHSVAPPTSLQSSISTTSSNTSSSLSSSSVAMNHSTIKSNNSNQMQSSMSHCIIITPSLMLEDHPSMHSTDHHTPVFVVQQHLPPNSSAHLAHPPPPTKPVKKEKCVSDIMHEAFQLLSYWPLDHPSQNCINTENEQQVYHSHLNMDEHLMF